MMTFTCIANVYVRDRDYSVYVGMNTVTRSIHVLKYDEALYKCEYEVFDSHLDAAAYLELLLD